MVPNVRRNKINLLIFFPEMNMNLPLNGFFHTGWKYRGGSYRKGEHSHQHSSFLCRAGKGTKESSGEQKMFSILSCGWLHECGQVEKFTKMFD